MSSAHPPQSFEKESKIQILVSYQRGVGGIFPEGANPLYALIKAGKY
jgi:hypothetical protein